MCYKEQLEHRYKPITVQVRKFSVSTRFSQMDLVSILNVTCVYNVYNAFVFIFRECCSDYTKLQILFLSWQGHRVSCIVEYLVLEDGTRVSKQGVRQKIARKPGSGLPPKLSLLSQKTINDAMCANDETTATQLQSILAAHGIYVSLATIVCIRRQLGWIYRESTYCQLILYENKEKQLNWAHTFLCDRFEGVIWSDEMTIQLETHRHHCYS